MKKELSEMTLKELWKLFPIILDEHNPEYKEWYAQEKESIVKAIGVDTIKRINHIGSSAVEGLISKPTVDILLEIDSNTDIDNLRLKLENAGWILMSYNNEPEFKMSYCKGYTPSGFDGKVFHLHVRFPGDWDELYFRDYLMTHRDVAKEYGDLKQKLKVHYEHNRDGYTEAKTDFINKWTGEARKEFPGRYLNTINNIDEMNIYESNLNYLKIIQDIFEVSAACSVKTYIWGGFVMDILEGQFQREHGDLDGFVENMMSVLDRLINEYKNRGYDTDFRSDINMLVIRRGARHAAFNPLDVDRTVAMWRHIGDQGTVYFPYSWLDKIPRKFYNTQVYTSGIYFEYAFRKIVHLLNPEWKEREKDKAAMLYYENRIKSEGIDNKAILKNIWSYNPFWIDKGYDPFDKPTLVWPGESEIKQQELV